MLQLRPCETNMNTTPATSLAELLERELQDKHGPLISNEALRVALGYPSMFAFRQAITRKTTPVPVFSIENRRGKFALVKDVAAWLATKRDSAVLSR